MKCDEKRKNGLSVILEATKSKPIASFKDSGSGGLEICQGFSEVQDWFNAQTFSKEPDQGDMKLSEEDLHTEELPLVKD